MEVHYHKLDVFVQICNYNNLYKITATNTLHNADMQHRLRTMNRPTYCRCTGKMAYREWFLFKRLL